ncbi:protein-L-isoaspartate(D-aspartate) O-methyltransferase [Gellertiella hungarica]|uniref:Protein-L-isoaspartate O-methyltransferase n=1 Tax=Gellertiella hungarica TaxID=1572859 RepID=A0A7W6J554_9HYPH|nr:protein-L-isoaspartate(D-aspartate) O-methyltransferase [Gellertiella hungarica]MBB4064978.1 protein-L-isoaspartate(D-aspartate) O-methyltransferase [Gellertiella hungarica]
MNARLGEKEGFAGLVLRLRAEGINDIDLLTAVEQTPRTQFVPSQYAASAYSSRTIPIECGAFMEGVDLAVRIIDRLKLKSGHRILEVGTGSGFTAAVMARLVERVLTIDRYRTLTTEAQKRFDQLGLRNIIVRHADGSAGLQGDGTFDRILVTNAFPSMPRFYAEQLVSGGSMIAPLLVGEDRCQMARLTKVGSRFETEILFDAPYLPIVPRLSSYL